MMSLDMSSSGKFNMGGTIGSKMLQTTGSRMINWKESYRDDLNDWYFKKIIF